MKRGEKCQKKAIKKTGGGIPRLIVSGGLQTRNEIRGEGGEKKQEAKRGDSVGKTRTKWEKTVFKGNLNLQRGEKGGGNSGNWGGGGKGL